MTRARTAVADRERGSAVWMMPFLGVLVLLTLVLAFHGGALVAQRRAQSAADLAALAGASALQEGDDGCAAAAATARRNHAQLSSCRVVGSSGRELVVTVIRDGPRLLGRKVDVEASARAGPGAEQ